MVSRPGDLVDGLGVRLGDVVSLVGAGGKTSLALRLTAELAGQGVTVVFTVTTRIYPPPLPLVLVEDDAVGGFRRVRSLLRQGPVCVAGRPGPQGKLLGVEPDAVARLADLAGVVVVEADGAAGRPLKFPLAHEPVIPPCTTLVVAVAGASVVGQPLDSRWVHRAEAAAAWLGETAGLGEVCPGMAVTPEMVAAVLAHPDGATRGRPARARLAVAINQADSPERLMAARAVARALVERGVERVVLTSARGEVPVLERVVSAP